jgi:hypothetical protein
MPNAANSKTEGELANRQIDNLMLRHSQKWSTDASNPCAGFGAGVIASTRN